MFSLVLYVNHPVLFLLAGVLIPVAVMVVAAPVMVVLGLLMRKPKLKWLGVAFVSKNFKIALAPILLMLVLFIFVPGLNAGTVGIMVPVSVLFTIATARIMYKRGVL